MMIGTIGFAENPIAKEYRRLSNVSGLSGFELRRRLEEIRDFLSQVPQNTVIRVWGGQEVDSAKDCLSIVNRRIENLIRAA